MCIDKKYIILYIEKWTQETYSDKCAVCEFYLQTNNNLHFVQRINDVGKEMPVNKVGVVLIWLYMINILKIDIDNALKIDPLSIFFHIILGCCENDADNVDAIGGILRSIILNPISKNKSVINKYKQFMTLFITIYKNGYGCSGHNCIYSDIGIVTEVIDMEQLTDMRHVISSEWVKKHTNVSICDFYGEYGYNKHQPGIEIYANNLLQNNDTNISTSKHFLLGNKSLNNEKCNLNEECKIMQNKEAQCRVFIFDIMFILFLCDTFDKVHNNEGTPIYCIHKFTEDCLWCSLCVIPEIRAIINDLVIMGKSKLTTKGIGSDVIQKIPMVLKNNTLCVKQTQSDLHPDFSYSFARFSVTKQIIRNILSEWFTEKYKIIQDMIPLDVDKIWKHVSCNTNILCKQNIRRMYKETDLHLKDDKHLCLITLELYVTELLEINQCKIKKESTIIRKIGYEHNIFIKGMSNIKEDSMNEEED